MPYNYYHISSPTRFSTSKAQFDYEFNQLLDEQFLIASTVYTIKEETSFGSNEFEDVVVRINRGLNVLTGQKLGDDFKIILFKDQDHDVDLGSLFYFENNYWITYNIEKVKNLATSAMVRRCNNVLRWTDETGTTYQEYCAIDYPVKRPVDAKRTADPVTPTAFIAIYAQLNAQTRKIKSGQRFLFGNTENWVCFRVYGGGVQNFLNRETTDNESAKLLQLLVGTDYVNASTDNLTLGIADYYDLVYTFSASPTSYSGKIGDTFKINPNLKLNGFSSDEDIAFSTSNSDIIDVDENGIVELVSSGSAVVSMYVETNTSASASINVSSSSSALSLYEIRVSPITNFVKEGDSETFEVYAYFNGSLQEDIEFIFSVSGSSIPSTSYAFSSIDENSFSVSNNDMYLDSSLIINAVSGSLSKDIEIELLGAW
jgi:hypothetical protein